MKDENAHVPVKGNKSGKLRLLKWILIGSVALLLLIFFMAPLYLSSAGGTQMLLGRINSSVDGQVQMDDFSIGWFKGVSLTNLSYDDSAGNTSVQVRRIETQPKYASLLGGKVKLGKTVVESPRVYLKVQEKPESVPSTKVSADIAEESAKPAPAFPIDQIDLELIDGAATIELVGDVPQTVYFANIASNVQISEAGKPSMVDISMDVDETSKISAKGTATPSKKGWTLKEGDFEVQISKLQLASLKPLFALAGQEMDMAGELNADATIQIGNNQIQQLKADAEITGFAQGTGDQRTVFDQPVKLSALIMGDEKAMTIERARVESAFCTVNCSGSMETVNYTVQADLEQTQKFAGQFADMQGLGMEGDLSMQGAVLLTEESIGVNGAGTITQLVAKKEGVQTPVTDVQMDFDCAVDKKANQFRLASVNMTATPGTVNIANVVLPLSAEATKTVSADAQAKLDLAKTWPFVQVFADLPKDVQLTGMLDSAVKVTTEASRVRLLTEKTQITKLKITRPDSEPFQQEKISLNADITLDTDNQTIDIQKLDMQAADGQSLIKISKGNVEKKISKNTTRFTGDFKAQYDLKTISAFASAYLPEGLTMEGKRSDLLHFESQYPTDQPELMTKNLNASGTFGFEKASYFGLNFAKTDISLAIKDGVADLNIPETIVNEGKLRFAGQVDLNQEPLMLRMDKPTQVIENIHVNEEMTKKLLARMNPIFNEQGDVSGFVSLKCNQLQIPFSGVEKDKLFVDAVVSLDNAQLQPKGIIKMILRKDDNTPVQTQLLPTHIILKDELVAYESMEFHLDQYPTGFSGTMRLDGYADMIIALPWKTGESKLRSVKVGEDLSGRLEVECQGYVKDFGECIDWLKLSANIAPQILIKDEETREAVEKGLELLEGIFK